MKFASSYELKKALKRLGYDFDGLQVKQINGHNGYDFLIAPLDTASLYDPITKGFRMTPENLELMNRLNELTTALKDSNVAVGSLTTESKPAMIGT